LAKDLPPWLDATAFVAWQGKLLGLLKPDVAELPLAPVVASWLDAHPALHEAMAAKNRTVFPLRTLLADEALRAHLVELIKAVRSAVRLPLVLVLPSPRAWVGLAYRQAHDGVAVVGDDEADSAAVYIADFLRSFGDTGLDALMLEEAADNEPTSAESIALYQPVLNVATHYQWDTALHLPSAAVYAAEAAGFVCLIAPQPIAGTVTGVVVEPTFWTGADTPAVSAGGFRYAEIPADVAPEQVLERLALLR
jgi:hypothetical protein